MVSILYIDDDIDRPFGGRHYQERLGDEGVRCELVPPPELDQLDSLVESPPDLFLIDHELSMVRPSGDKAAYRGTTLAAEIRARAPDWPIVLITRETVLQTLSAQARRQITEAMKVCDALILKRMIDEDVARVRAGLESIAVGFAALRETEDKRWESLVRVLGAEADEAGVLHEAAAPLEEGKWFVAGTAEWIRNVILRFPGILYNAVNAATRLGISEQAFCDDELQGLFEPAQYTGVFAPPEGRWWKGRLLVKARAVAAQEGVDGPINQAFPEAFHKRFDREAPPAICVWDRQPIADWVCHILDKPVKIKHSLRYYPDARPAVMDQARVSFRAIRESSKFDQELLDAEGLGMLSDIEELAEP